MPTIRPPRSVSVVVRLTVIRQPAKARGEHASASLTRNCLSPLRRPACPSTLHRLARHLGGAARVSGHSVFASYFEGQRSLIAVPHYDQGRAINMVILKRESPGAFAREGFPEWFWLSSLFGGDDNCQDGATMDNQ